MQLLYNRHYVTRQRRHGTNRHWLDIESRSAIGILFRRGIENRVIWLSIPATDITSPIIAMICQPLLFLNLGASERDGDYPGIAPSQRMRNPTAIRFEASRFFLSFFLPLGDFDLVREVWTRWFRSMDEFINVTSAS